ncbi:MAG: GNAT family N-acetyltransferase [Anaerolineae bacterium]|nr:GNAT family N-acetyltransferase [Anaerolineae bacterium]
MSTQTHLSYYIRPVCASDAANLNTLCWAKRSPTRVNELIARASKLMDKQRGMGVVGVCDNAACAFGMLTLWPRTAEVSDLIVNTQYRGCGIGSAIIRYLTETACSLNVQTLEIGAALSNPRALALYRRLGFSDDRVIVIDLGQGPEPVLYLTKQLSRD